jgi:hypothetical protein
MVFGKAFGAHIDFVGDGRTRSGGLARSVLKEASVPVLMVR